MAYKPLLIVILVLALTTLACSVTINLPRTDLKTGPTQTEELSVPLLSDPSTVAFLQLSFGAGKLSLKPGAQSGLLQGTAKYNVPDFKPKINTIGSNVTIEQGNITLKGIPEFNEKIINEWDLALGDAPMDLTIHAGAYSADYNLGGLSLHNLEISDGAASVVLSFTEPNHVSMDKLRYTTGASDVTINHLANADFSQMIFKGGAGSYQLDFSGDLKRDALVKIDSGISSVKIIVPQGVSADVTIEGAFTSVNARGAWERSGSKYVLSGSGPTLSITVTMGAGSLDLEN